MLGAAALAVAVTAQPFNTANLVVLRLGDGTAPAVSSNAQPYFIDELSVTSGSSATTVRTISLPTAGNNACTGSGTTTFEGGGTTSWDGRYVVTQCFTAPVGTATVQSNALYPQRQINRIRADGAVHHGA